MKDSGAGSHPDYRLSWVTKNSLALQESELQGRHLARPESISSIYNVIDRQPVRVFTNTPKIPPTGSYSETLSAAYEDRTHGLGMETLQISLRELAPSFQNA